jgi:hypothetical protein
VILSAVVPIVQAPATGAEFPVSAAIAATVSVLVFWLGNRSTRRAAQKERQRQVVEDWLRTLAKLVDDYEDSPQDVEYRYRETTNRQVLELSFSRKNRYLAWWMHEMAVAIMIRGITATKDPAPAAADMDRMLATTGDFLLAWHHGELKSSDFHIPYQLHRRARDTKLDVHELAEGLNLTAYVEPVRMTLRRSWKLQKLLVRPETGMPILQEINSFIPKRYAVVALPIALVDKALIPLRLAVLRQRLKWLGKRAAKL